MKFSTKNEVEIRIRDAIKKVVENIDDSKVALPAKITFTIRKNRPQDPLSQGNLTVDGPIEWADEK
jgi:hypothetical protein